MAENTQQSPQQHLTLAEIVDKAMRLNDPAVSVELRQRALTSLLIETCYHLAATRESLGKATKALAAKCQALEAQDATIMGAVQDVAAGAASAQNDAQAASAHAAAATDAAAMQAAQSLGAEVVGNNGGVPTMDFSSMAPAGDGAAVMAPVSVTTSIVSTTPPAA